MIAELKNHQPEIADLCRRYGVRRLDIFGSGATGEHFDPARSDLDLLVDFAPHSQMGPADQYFGLLDELKHLFEREIDLVSARSLRNPFFIESVNRSKQVLYDFGTSSFTPTTASTTPLSGT